LPRNGRVRWYCTVKRKEFCALPHGVSRTHILIYLKFDIDTLLPVGPFKSEIQCRKQGQIDAQKDQRGDKCHACQANSCIAQDICNGIGHAFGLLGLKYNPRNRDLMNYWLGGLSANCRRKCRTRKKASVNIQFTEAHPGKEEMAILLW
jgi:hypothetical protein